MLRTCAVKIHFPANATPFTPLLRQSGQRAFTISECGRIGADAPQRPWLIQSTYSRCQRAERQMATEEPSRSAKRNPVVMDSALLR
jgi:hypothetical protein